MRRFLLNVFTWAGIGLLGIFVAVAILFYVGQTFGFQFVRYFGIDKTDLPLIGIGIIAFVFIPIFMQEREDRRQEHNDRKRELAEIFVLVRAREQVLISVGTQQTFEDALRYVRRSEYKIETIVSGGPKAPDHWLVELRGHLVSMKQRGTPVQYDVLIYTPVEIARTPEFLEGIRKRNAAFKKDGVDMRVRVIETNRLLGFDVMIIDAKHVCIGISPASHTDRSMAINLENHDQAGSMFSSWFERLSRDAIEITS